MPDQTAIDSALLTIAETEFGAGTFSLEAEAEVQPDKGLIVYNGYSVDRLPYRQELVAYEYVLLFKKSAGSDSAAARDSVSDSLEAIREAMRTDAPLAALVHDARVTELQLQSLAEGGHVVGAMAIEAEVIK